MASFLFYGFGFGYRYLFDPTYMLVIIGAVLCLIASAKVKSTYAKYQRVRSVSGLTGAMAAERILHNAGIYNVSIQRVSGNLTDHYDPRSKVLKLSDAVYNDTSVAAIGVAAHECGHAIQDNKDYAPMRLRGMIVPVANIGSSLSWPMIFLGIIIGWYQPLITLGIALFSLAVIFQLVTLPVEFNASKRAVAILGDTGMLYGEEISHVKKVLTAAALTYVAGAVSSILQLLRLVILFGNRNRD